MSDVAGRHTDADGQGLRWGVESICSQLTELGCTIAPATYYEHRSRRPCAQEQRGADLKPLITKVHGGDLGQCGVDAGDQQIDD